MLGRFLEISVQTEDVLGSLDFYERLGFSQAQVGETWTHPYGVVTDGRLAIGLHRYEFDSPALTFVQPDLLRGLERLEALGIEPAFRRLGADVFNEAGFTDPDGQMITLLEARTFSPAQRPAHQTSRLGWFEELALPARDLKRSREFWERLGFVTVEETEDPWPRLGLTSDSLSISLSAGAQITQPTLVFTGEDMSQRIRELTDAGTRFARSLPRGLDPAANALLVAPDGIPMLLLTA